MKLIPGARCRKKLIALATAIACSPTPQAQVTHHPDPRPAIRPRALRVPDQTPTIQSAIDLARDGDVVLVSPGTYLETIDFRGKAIEVIGTQGPARTVLRPPTSNPVVRFRSSEGPGSRLIGFTIRNGDGDFAGAGGGISCSDFELGTSASPYISDCIIERNSTDPIFGNGPGAGGVDGDAILERCVLRWNSAAFESGGAVRGAVTMLQCVVEDNSACTGGGGLYLLPGALLQDCLIRRNSAGPCTYHGGSLPASGGGILAPLGPVELVGCVLQDNSVDEYPEPGDPGWCHGLNRGGALDAGSAVTLRRCTIVGNHALRCAQIGGLLGSPTLVDSILTGNDDPSSLYASQSSFRFSVVQGGAAGPGCIDADPLFVDATGGDLRLRDGSPCIDAGDPSSPLDPDGTRADLGAYHHPDSAAPLSVAWHQTARLVAQDPQSSNRFGTAVALQGDTALIGSEGAAYVFRRTGSSWSEEARLVPGNPQPDDHFGTSVTLDGDVAVIGAPRRDTLGGYDGAVFVFERATAGAPFLETVRLVPDVPASNERFGLSVALDSGFLVVGAPDSEWGRAFVFQRRGRSSWRQVAELLGRDDYTPSFTGSNFGASVAISGTTIVVGAPLLEADSQVPGGAYVYERAGATPFSWVRVAELLPEGTQGMGRIGSSVSISLDALLVGSAFGVFAYERSGPGLPWSRPVRIGPFEPATVRMQGRQAWVAHASGEVRELFQPSPHAGWSEIARFAAAAGAVAADQGTLLAGAPLEDGSVGACRVFSRGPQVDAISLDQAADEEDVVIAGEDLDQVTRVRVGGLEQVLLAQSATELRIRPARRDPGFADLELETPAGALTLASAFHSAPTLSSGANGIGGTLEVELENGAPGALVLLYALDLRASPRAVVDPPTWYGLWLALAPGSSGVLAVDAFDSSGRTELVFPVPDDPGLAGVVLHLQAWCRRGLFGAGRNSFTNASSTTL